jgi:hypothetical protein
MHLWYSLVIGVPIAGSFIISLVMFLIFGKLLKREVQEDGSSKFRCKRRKDNKNNVSKVIPNASTPSKN